MSEQRVLVTAGLPYANGSIHLGHLVEYCQVDMYVRARKRLGDDAIYICADDTHGTPIEVNARKLKLEPVELIRRVHAEHIEDFARFDVAFDHFSTTDSVANRSIVEHVYSELRRRGFLEDRSVDGNWCEHDQRFLPDRFIKGDCPSCGAPDQYGDVCEVCGKTHAPTDLKNPHCVMCGGAPVIRASEHVFFKLSDPRVVAFLRQWVDSGPLSEDTANYVKSWLDTGLRDWCISRDGPYFGFEIPDRPGKFFYVWLDAPLGYVASSREWGEANGVSFTDLWQSAERTRIEHVIGKDIVYFHTLFWPAVLNAVGYTLPSKVYVHGMLTINGQKMSKSRGTSICASTFAKHIEPQALRYYYACKYGSSTSDLDLSFDDFILRVNGELVNKHANLFSRMSQLLSQRLDNRLGDLPFSAAQVQQEPDADTSESLLGQARRVVQCCRRIEKLYRERELGQVVRELSIVADIGNELMQAQKPWDQLKTDVEAARTTLTFVANVCYALAMYLWPIVPRFAEAAARGLGVTMTDMNSKALFGERKRSLGTFERLFERIERTQVDAIVAASIVPDASANEVPARKASVVETRQTVASSTSPAVAVKDSGAVATLIDYEQFQGVDLRVGVIVRAEAVPKSKKLVRLEVDLGEASPRQIVAGIALTYEPGVLVGTRVVVVANLKPAKLMGIESHGMLLAAGEANSLSLVRLEQDVAAGTRVK